MSSTISLYGKVRYTNSVGFTSEMPVAQIVEGPATSTKNVRVAAGDNVEGEFDTEAPEIVYLHVYANTTVRLRLYKAGADPQVDPDVVVQDSLLKGHTILSLAPGCGYLPKFRLDNPSSTKTAEVVMVYGIVPDDGLVPDFYQD